MKNADIILKGKAVFTGLKEAPFEGAVALSGNTIIKVIEGTDFSGLIGPDTRIYDCGNGLIMPGIIDAHAHFIYGALTLSPYLCLELEKSKSESECVAMMQRYSAQHPEAKRLMGHGWFPANWNDAPLPSKNSLDKVFPDKPVYLVCADVHTAWLNTRALEECGIDRNTSVSCGEIVKGADGEPTGLLIEMEAVGLALRKMLQFTKEEQLGIYMPFLQLLAQEGITGTSEITAFSLNKTTLNLFETLKEIEADGHLSTRLYLYSSLGATGEYSTELETAKRYASSRLRYSGLKQFVDGVTSTYTAFLLEPYSDKPETSGFTNYSKAHLQKCVSAANALGIGVRLHCVGDGAVHWALDIFEESNRVNNNEGNAKGLRNAVEHIEDILPSDIPRFAKLGVIASVQPYHLTLDANEKIIRIGAERCRSAWPHRSLIDAGAVLALGTDHPVVSPSPFRNIYSAVTRCNDAGKPTGVNPEEAMTLPEALRAYTLGSARIYGVEKELGTLEEGKIADIAVLDRNLFAVLPQEILQCRVNLTLLDGKVVFKR